MAKAVKKKKATPVSPAKFAAAQTATLAALATLRKANRSNARLTRENERLHEQICDDTEGVALLKEQVRESENVIHSIHEIGKRELSNTAKSWYAAMEMNGLACRYIDWRIAVHARASGNRIAQFHQTAGEFGTVQVGVPVKHTWSESEARRHGRPTVERVGDAVVAIPYRVIFQADYKRGFAWLVGQDRIARPCLKPALHNHGP